MNQRREAFTPEEIVLPSRLRSGINEASVVSLMQSIERIGLRTPLTVRWDKDGDDDTIVLVAGRHRLEACKRLGMELVDCITFDGTETEARLWEIAENLHRADLTTLERSEHIAEWVRLTEEKLGQVAQVSSGGRGKMGGLSAATRELGIERTEARRAVKIDSIAPEAKEAAREAGIDDNQAALSRVASEPSPSAQLAATRKERELAEARRRNRRSDRAIALTKSQQLAAWLIERADLHELPALISLVEGCKPRDVSAALRLAETAIDIRSEVPR